MPLRQVRLELERASRSAPRQIEGRGQWRPAVARLVGIRPRQSCPGQRVSRIERQRLLEVLDALRGVLARQALGQETTVEIEPMRFGIAGPAFGRNGQLGVHRVCCRRIGFAFHERQPQVLHYLVRNVVLHREDVLELAVIDLRPQVGVGRHANELGGDPYALARRAYAAFEDRRHIELFRNGRDVHVLALETERGRARGHAQAAHLG